MNTPRSSTRDARTITPLPTLPTLPTLSCVSFGDLDPPLLTKSPTITHENLPIPSTLTAINHTPLRANLTHMRQNLHAVTARIATLESSIPRTYSSISCLPSPPLSPPLPEHIERLYNVDGRPYYVNHATQTTSWENPLKMEGAEERRPCRISLVTRRTSWENPLPGGEQSTSWEIPMLVQEERTSWENSSLVVEEGEGEDTELEEGEDTELEEGEGEMEGIEAAEIHAPRPHSASRPPSPTLPAHITRDHDEHGRPYYSNHHTHTTSWFHPLHRLPTPRPSYRHPAEPAPYPSDPASHALSRFSHRHFPSPSSHATSPLPPITQTWHEPLGRAFDADRATAITGSTSWLHPGGIAGAREGKEKMGMDVRYGAGGVMGGL